MGLGSGIAAFGRGAWWLVRHGPVFAVNWLRTHASAAFTILWLGGMAFFVVTVGVRTVEAKRAAEEKKRIALAAAREAEISERVAAQLEGRPTAAQLAAAAASAQAAATPSPAPVRAAGPKPSVEPEEPAGAGREEIVELMDVDEMERARGGSDLETKEAIAGLAEEYEGEDGGVAAGGEARRGDGGVGTETMALRGGVTLKMKEGGIAAWINRNQKYRKRKLGDKETLAVLAEVHGGHGTKMELNPNSPLGGLAAIAAARGSAVLEAKESGGKLADGNEPPEGILPPGEGKPGGAPPVRTTATPAGKERPRTPGRPPSADGGVASPEGERPASPDRGNAPSAAEPPSKPSKPSSPGPALAALAAPGANRGEGSARGFDLTALGRAVVVGLGGFGASADPQLVGKLLAALPPGLEVEVTSRGDRVAMLLPGDLVFETANATELTPKGVVLVAYLAAILVQLPGQRFEVAGHLDGPAAAGEAALVASLRDRSFVRALEVARILVEGGLDAGAISATAHGGASPLVPNDTPESRARNRRIEIVLLPRP